MRNRSEFYCIYDDQQPNTKINTTDKIYPEDVHCHEVPNIAS